MKYRIIGNGIVDRKDLVKVIDPNTVKQKISNTDGSFFSIAFSSARAGCKVLLIDRALVVDEALCVL